MGSVNPTQIENKMAPWISMARDVGVGLELGLTSPYISCCEVK